MLPDLPTTVVIIVFAGGPHTATRFELFEQRLPNLAPDAVYLTGADFQDRYAARIRDIPVHADDCRTTITSCFSLARRLREQYPDGARLRVFTSNYHAPRVAWLLRGVLPGRYELNIETSRDMTWQTVRTESRSRRLFLGEIKSWFYCGPAGLLLRPLPTAAILFLGGLLLWRRKRSRPHASS